MKNILVATDLSLAATNAANYAAQLAAATGARLTLMSVYKPMPVLTTSSVPESRPDNLSDLVTSRLEDSAARLETTTGIPVGIICRLGDSTRTILRTAREIDADLIVVGKTGTKCREGVPFGNTATTLARKTTIPLLIVPQEAQYVHPSTIAMAGNILSHETPAMLRELLSSFAARLYLFRVAPREPGKVVEISRFDAIHSNAQQFHLYDIPVNNQLRHSIENFIEVNPIDLLVVRPIQGTPPERWMLKDTNKELTFEIRIPLLVLP